MTSSSSGGSLNNVGGRQLVITGGFSANALGLQSVVLGGAGNFAGGNYSTVPGGTQNLAYNVLTFIFFVLNTEGATDNLFLSRKSQRTKIQNIYNILLPIKKYSNGRAFNLAQRVF